MELMRAGLLLLLFSSASGYQVSSGAEYDSFVQDPEFEWERMETVIDEEMPQDPTPEVKISKSALHSVAATPGAKKVPPYVIVSASEDQKEMFKPEKGFRSLPNLVKQRMYVRIRREVFKTRDAYKNLKLGTCPANHGSPEHYYFLYLLKTDCGFKRESNVDYQSISNVLHYKSSSPVLRELPFDIPLQCNHHRFFHSYKVGFYPTLQGGTVFKTLSQRSFALTTQDASGNEITGVKTYILGEPMYFQASSASSTASSVNQRTYINKCFIMASQNPNSLKYTIIDNHGCMMDGKVTDQSRFLTGASQMIQRFSVSAMIFKDLVSSSSQQLYMHCEITVGALTPTPSSKACNYDPAARGWKELYGDDSMCTCCDNTCSVVKEASRKMISSHSWKVSKDADVDTAPWLKI